MNGSAIFLMLSTARQNTQTRQALRIATDLTSQFIHIAFADDREIKIIDLLHRGNRHESIVRLSVLRFGPLTADQLRSHGWERTRWNILIQPKEVVGIVMRFDGYHAIPSFVIRLWHPLLLVATHKIHIHARFHRGAKFIEDSADPGNVSRIGGRFRPASQDIKYERSAAIAEGSLARGDPRSSAR